jgi:hypothetical protein
MDASKSLERLLGVRQAEEERSQQEMEATIRELQRLELAHATSRERGKRARTMVASSAQTGEVMDRIAGLQEIAAADRLDRMLLKRIDVARKDAQEKRQELLTRRLARRQVETLVGTKLAEAEAEANRKTQSALDDWHRSQRKPEMRRANAALFESDIPLTK